MPKISKHKQAKRKQRQRNVQASKSRQRLKDVQEKRALKDQMLLQQLNDTLGGEHAMSDEMKKEAKEKFWKVFSTLPRQLQKDAMKSFEKEGNTVTPLDLDGMTNLLCEGLNHYIRPHALVATLHSLVEQEKLVLTEALVAKMDALDAAVLKYINNATAVLEAFQSIRELDEEKQHQAILDNDVLSERLIPTLLSYQEDSEEIITPLIELAEPHTELINDDIKFVGEVLGKTNLYDVSREIHLERVEELVTVKGE